MSIIRIEKEENYFAISNIPLNDKRLSWEARGMLGYLLSKPNNWEVRFTDLVNQSEAGEHKVRRILKELQEYKYLERKKIRGADGKFTWVSTIRETPDGTILRKSPDGEGQTISQLSTLEEPRDLTSTESINTEDKEEEDINPNGKYGDYEVAFCNKSHLPPLTPSPKKWFEAMEKLDAAGVEPVDIENAVGILRDRDYSIIGISSVVNTAINEMSKRVGKQTEQDRSKYVEGEYADFIEH